MGHPLCPHFLSLSHFQAVWGRHSVLSLSPWMSWVRDSASLSPPGSDHMGVVPPGPFRGCHRHPESRLLTKAETRAWGWRGSPDLTQHRGEPEARPRRAGTLPSVSQWEGRAGLSGMGQGPSARPEMMVALNHASGPLCSSGEEPNSSRTQPC